VDYQPTSPRFTDLRINLQSAQIHGKLSGTTLEYNQESQCKSVSFYPIVFEVFLFFKTILFINKQKL
jgi:hypothetical protein